MDSLDKNLLIKTALLLDLSDLIKLCRANKRINNLLCNNQDFWRQKLFHDYPYTIGQFPNNSNYKYIYERTKNAVIFEKDLDEISEGVGKENKEIDWRQAKYLIINVTDFYLAERISIRPEFIFDKKIPHEAEQEFIFNLILLFNEKASQQLYDNIIKEQKDHNFESDNEEEDENEENESDTQSE